MTFPPTYTVTCAQTDRPAKAREHFAESGVPARFIQGVYGRQWGLETRLWCHREPPDGFKIDTGHVGLNLSHWMIWQIALDRGCEEVLICEDDAIFCPDFLGRYAEHRAQLPEDWQIWYVGSVGQCDHLRSVTPHIRALDHRGPHGTHCYLVRRSALPVLLETCQECRVYIDQTINYNAMPHLTGYASCPSLVAQHSAQGTWGHAVGGNPAPTDPPIANPKSFPDNPNIAKELAGLEHVPGWCCPEKRKVIYDAVLELARKLRRAPVCVELGVFGGQSLLPAAMALRDHGQGKIIGIDPYTMDAAIEGQEPGEHKEWWSRNVDYAGTQFACRAEIKERGLDRWCEVRACLPESCAHEFVGLDYLHLDDSHATPVAMRNTQMWLPKLLPGGILVLDDCEWESVQPARELIAAELELVSWDESPGRRWEVYRRTPVVS